MAITQDNSSIEELVATATTQINALKVTLNALSNLQKRTTNGKRILTKVGQPLVAMALDAIATHPEVVDGNFDASVFSNQVNHLTLTLPVENSLKETLHSFLKKRRGVEQDVEFQKREIYAGLDKNLPKDTKYAFYHEKLSTEYAKQGPKAGKQKKKKGVETSLPTV